MELEAKDRLIVALDVSTAKEALSLVEDLEGIVSFFKLGWQLFIGGEWNVVIDELKSKDVFIDLKLPGDIGNTIESTVRSIARWNVKFVTLSNSVSLQTIEAAIRGRDGSARPNLLMVPLYSSLDGNDLIDMSGSGTVDVDAFIGGRAEWAIKAGCDGLIASGTAISMLRARFPKTTIVSPGIRLAGSSVDDHKRLTTPGEAIRSGADHLVVGRPVRSPETRGGRRRVAEQIVAEIESAAKEPRPVPGRSERHTSV